MRIAIQCYRDITTPHTLHTICSNSSPPSDATDQCTPKLPAIKTVSSPRQRDPVCSVLGKTYGNECLLHKEACRKRRSILLAHTGACLSKHTQMQPLVNITQNYQGLL
uniref:Kazal-like domain-containing protein n=1 Tax=Gouania willdenowi TaxID=441366 RepID=A0A8C5HQ54_GOUWI